MATNTNDTTLGYFQIIGKCEETDDSSYTRTTADGKEETVSKVQLSLVIPGMQDRVRVELPLELAPSTDLLSQWELEESWLVVSGDGHARPRLQAHQRPGRREGRRLAWSIFAGSRRPRGDARRAQAAPGRPQGAEGPGQAAPRGTGRREGRSKRDRKRRKRRPAAQSA